MGAPPLYTATRRAEKMHENVSERERARTFSQKLEANSMKRQTGKCAETGAGREQTSRMNRVYIKRDKPRFLPAPVLVLLLNRATIQHNIAHSNILLPASLASERTGQNEDVLHLPRSSIRFLESVSFTLTNTFDYRCSDAPSIELSLDI